MIAGTKISSCFDDEIFAKMLVKRIGLIASDENNCKLLRFQSGKVSVVAEKSTLYSYIFK